MQAEPFEIRALAHRVRAQGAATSAAADALAGRARDIGWTGLAGAAMVGRTTAQARILGEIADQHDTAARALEAHAAAVEQSLALIAEIERRVHTAMAGARCRVRRFLDGVLDSLDPVDDALASFVPPPPGSPDWLHVRIPGLSLPGLPW
ncbi:hypothetical protein SAMN04487968_10465 [Nocardioides terrae]|uniref:Uncharacterized protein n=1 Tax=Nocardioides terrae TaxID=574651 RepID=A0A1I1GT41_9ACTN|nr:hypothetical protein [Nocardioides terrae]SFC14824.1 hypothetical protein SAMN04487968_10465 [Nocardioides terrae]